MADSFYCQLSEEILVYMVDYINGFLYVGPSVHPWDEAYLFVEDDFPDVFLDSICQYFIEYFCINVHEGDWSLVCCLSCVFVTKVCFIAEYVVDFREGSMWCREEVSIQLVSSTCNQGLSLQCLCIVIESLAVYSSLD
ncbi:hypothetical protein H671_xg20352 [Cricetulus griseus]|uniref:Uncharacterized protein n=1 Tax=Cricetulus griseus TaxID=10029 RepID=A0A061I0D3_CRIGR|nr:hypothetical protein H671_xg20352 [Cricetulus griseus]